jgi:tyrosine-protein kinase Etk/Wzc
MASSGRNDERYQRVLGPSDSTTSTAFDAPSDAAAAGDVIDLLAVWTALTERWRFILGMGFLVWLGVMSLTVLARMQFESNGRLYLGELDGKGRTLNDLDISGGGQGDVASEIEILKSRSIFAEAILNSGLNAQLQPTGWSPPRLWHWLLSGRNPKLLQAAGRELTLENASLPEGVQSAQDFHIRFSTPHDYQLFVRDTPIASGSLDFPTVTKFGTLTLRGGSQSRPKSGAEYDLRVSPLDDVIEDVSSNLVVTVPKVRSVSNEMVKVISLEFTHRSPTQAAEFLTQLMKSYLSERQSWKVEDATAAESFVTKQLQGMRASLDSTERKLADYRSNTSMVVLDNEAKAMIEQMGKYEEQRVAARLQVAALSDVKRALKNPNPPVEAYLLGEARDTVLEGLGRSLADARQDLTELESRFNDAAPDVRNQKAQIAAQLETIRNYVTSRLGRAQENLSALNGIIGQFEDKLKTVPGAELVLAQLARESDVYSRLYSYLLERQQQAAILKASTVSKNRVLDAPIVPRRESSPRLGLRHASFLLGLVLAALFVILRRFLATTVQSESDVGTVAGNVPLFATIPRAGKRGRLPAGASAPPFRSLAADPTSPFTEALRTLRASVCQTWQEHAQKVWLVTSAVPGDGKTTLTLSLASMLAADGKWVLVVDADLRKPSHHILTGHGEEQGLRGVLSGQCNWREVVRPVSVSSGEFFSIGAGKMAPGELISNDRMTRFLIEARNRYDFILLDGPSFPLVADAVVLAPLSDGVLSVARLGHTPRRLLGEHLRRLSQVAHGQAVVVNGGTEVHAYGYGASQPNVAARSGLTPLKLKPHQAKLD